MKNLIAILVVFFSVSLVSVATVNVNQSSTAISAVTEYSSFVKDDKPKKKKKSSACTSEQKASSSCCSPKAASCCSKEKAKE